jgi:hypothetical protein
VAVVSLEIQMASDEHAKPWLLIYDNVSYGVLTMCTLRATGTGREMGTLDRSSARLVE